MDFGFHLERWFNVGRAAIDDEKWAQGIANEVSERGENKKREDARLVIEYNLKNSCAPKFWEETREAVKRKVELLNKTLGVE